MNDNMVHPPQNYLAKKPSVNKDEKGKIIIDDDQCQALQRNLRKKLEETIKENENKKIKIKEKEKEIEKKYNFFCEKICDILITSNNILDDNKSSESLKNLKNSD